MKKFIVATLMILPQPMFAESNPSGALQSYFDTHIAPWVGDSVFISAISAQNNVTRYFDQAEIDKLDAQWQAEIGSRDSKIINDVLTNSASEVLRSLVQENEGVVTEVFLTDAKGLNVAMSETTSDYWQGDEDKFVKVFPVPNKTFISEVEFDESTQTYQAQVSVTISDPETGEAIGTLTVGLNAEAIL